MKRMNFSEVLEGLHQGKRYRREAWGKAFIFLVHGSTFVVNREPLKSILGEGTIVTYHSHIDMMSEIGYVTTWTASQPDLLAIDWEEVLAENS